MSDSDGSEEGPELSKDTIFTLLQNSRRRRVLRYLEEHGEASLSELARYIASQENESHPDEVGNDMRRKVYISLYQTHIPRMADIGVIDYDREEKTIRLRDPASQLLIHLHLEITECNEEPRGMFGSVKRWLNR